MVFCRAILTCLIGLLSSTVTPAEVDEVNEPKQEAQLEVNGQVIPLTYETAANIQIDGKTVPVTLKQSDDRLLNLQHISFRYPAYFKYSMSRSGNSGAPTRWDLEGHEIEFSVFRQPAEKMRYQNSEHPLSDWVSKIFENNGVERTCPILKLKSLDLKGTGYALPFKSGMINAELWLDVYEVPGNFGNFRYFLLLTDWDGEALEEEALMRKLLVESFAIREEPLNSEWRVKYDD